MRISDWSSDVCSSDLPRPAQCQCVAGGGVGEHTWRDQPGAVGGLQGAATAMNRQPPEQNGFTLIEMIVVIVITGILAGVLSRFLSDPVRGYLQVASRAVQIGRANVCTPVPNAQLVC